MSQYKNSLQRLVIDHITPYKNLLLAFSGGLDSTVLLDILTNLRNESKLLNYYNKQVIMLRAIYIHHNLSQHANHWATHCANICKYRQIEFNIIRVIIDNQSEGIEASARNARYQAIATILKHEEVLLTAHHKNDQVETLLLALKRGSGPAGLSAMSSDTTFLNYRVIRPFLKCKKTQLEKYAYEQKLNWIEDDSNRSTRFDRNFLRINILPLLRERWPFFDDTVARSANNCAEQEALIDELLTNTLNSIIDLDGSLKLKTLKLMSNIKRNVLIRKWIAKQNIRMPSRKQLKILWQEIAISRCDSVAQLQIDNYCIRKFQERLYVFKKTVIDYMKNEIIWPIENQNIYLSDELGIIYRYTFAAIKLYKNTNNYNCFNVKNFNKREMNIRTIVRSPSMNESVSLRFGSVHGLIYISGKKYGKKLKKLWQELNIPPWLRRNIPLLFYNNKLIAALGVFVTDNGSVIDQNKQWHIYWYRK